MKRFTISILDSALALIQNVRPVSVDTNGDIITDADGNAVANIRVAEAAMDAKGNYPTTWYLEDSVVSTGAATLYTSGDVSIYNRFTLNTSGTGTETVTVGVSVDGVNFVDAILFDANTGAVHGTADITTDGMYYLDGKYKAIRIVQAGAGTPTVRFAHSVA